MIRMSAPEWQGLQRVISGGQVGADIAGVTAARDCGLETGGTMPLGFRTWTGPRPEYASEFQMVEDKSYSYVPRTITNVRDGTGTVIIAANPNSPGCALTSSNAGKLNRPCLVLPLHDGITDAELNEYAGKLKRWIISRKITVLNVAGNRDFAHSTFIFDCTYMIVWGALMGLKDAIAGSPD